MLNPRLTGAAVTLCSLAGLLLAGCGPTFGPQAANGIVFYCPGAGNMDFGDTGIRKGLEAAGFQGQVATFVWTIAPLNPALDHSARLNARLRAGVLAGHLKQYLDEYPGRPVTLIGLSAGSGVALWALENLDDGYAVDNVVLLASSLSHDYDVSKAVAHVRGNIYNYYSAEDPILAGPMKFFGTVDGKFGVDGAGSVGLRPARHADRVINIAWQPEFKRYGYHGGHTDVTAPQFVYARIAQHVTMTPTSRMPDTTPASPPGPPPPVAQRR